MRQLPRQSARPPEIPINDFMCLLCLCGLSSSGCARCRSGSCCGTGAGESRSRQRSQRLPARPMFAGCSVMPVPALVYICMEICLLRDGGGSLAGLRQPACLAQYTVQHRLARQRSGVECCCREWTERVVTWGSHSFLQSLSLLRRDGAELCFETILSEWRGNFSDNKACLPVVEIV